MKYGFSKKALINMALIRYQVAVKGLREFQKIIERQITSKKEEQEIKRLRSTIKLQS